MTKPLRIAVEGNIGVGKSTLLPKLNSALPGVWKVLDERVDEDPVFRDLLAEFYKDPNKQAHLQSWLTKRRLDEFKAIANDPSHYLFERSFLGEIVFSHANFLRHEKPDGMFMGFFYNTLNALKQCKYDAVIYLRAMPERCYERIKFRSRSAEVGISYEYIKYLHACYETHLPETARAFGIPLITIDWENFGSVESLKDQLLTGLEGREISLIKTANGDVLL